MRGGAHFSHLSRRSRFSRLWWRVWRGGLAAMLLTSLLLALLGAVQWKMRRVDGGVLLEIRAREAAIARQETRNALLEQENGRIREEIIALKEHPDVILEERARTDLNMIKPGEILVQVFPGRAPP